MFTLAQAAAQSSGLFSNIALLITALAGGGLLTALVQWLANRGKSTAEEAETWTRISSSRLKSVHEEMSLLETRLKAMNAEVEQERRLRIAKDIDLQYAVHLLLQHNIEWRPPSGSASWDDR